MITDDAMEQGTSFAHVRTLLGVGWDAALLWLLYGMAGAWLWWWVWVGGGSGPVDALSELLDWLGAEEPNAVTSFADWLAEPARSALGVFAAVAAAVVAIVWSARMTNGTQIGTLVLALVAVQIGGMPVMGWTFAVIGAFTSLALVWCLVDARGHDIEDVSFVPGIVIGRGAQALVPLALVLLVPLVVVAAVVRCFAARDGSDASLAALALRRLRQSGDEDDLRAGLHALVIAGVLGQPHGAARQRELAAMHAVLEGPTGAR